MVSVISSGGSGTRSWQARLGPGSPRLRAACLIVGFGRLTAWIALELRRLDKMGSLSYRPFLGWLVQVRSLLDRGGCLLLYQTTCTSDTAMRWVSIIEKRVSLICAYLPWAIRGNLGA